MSGAQRHSTFFVVSTSKVECRDSTEWAGWALGADDGSTEEAVWWWGEEGGILVSEKNTLNFFGEKQLSAHNGKYDPIFPSSSSAVKSF